MRKFIALLLLYFVRFSLWFRYKVTIKGTENLNAEILNKPGGVLFLPNHPTAFVDPTLVTLAVWKKYPVRPMIVEYMYYTPGIHIFMRFLNALPIPNFVSSSNSFKKKKVDQVMETVIEGLKQKENFLIYPAGKTKHQAKEIIGASGIHKIIEASPEANVVLVKTTGLWGSRFSRALDGTIPPIFPTIFWGMKTALKSLLFFLPRRSVTLEFVPAPADFPYQGSRLEINRYLEKWYNRPDHVPATDKSDEETGETLNLVSYSLWKNDIPEIKKTDSVQDDVSIKDIPSNIQEKIKDRLSEMAQMPVDKIHSNMDLNRDLGLDSLDVADLVAFLDDEFETSGVPVNELTTVGKVMALAAHQVSYGEEVDDDDAVQVNLAKWFKSRAHVRATMVEGKTLPEVFLNTCKKWKTESICADRTAGILTFNDAKLRVVLLAEYIRQLPGDHIGILLPSSVAAYLTIFACQLAGKIPVMINWTSGPRHLESVVSLSGIKTVLSSWAFLDKLENVDLTPVEDLIVMLEDARRNFSLKDKIKAFYRSKLSTKSLLSIFNVDTKTEEDTAVILFTSGTESMPKGVPLSFKNILSNQRAAVKDVEIYEDDIWIGMLPPFHSFGFTISGLLPILCGTRIAYYPDPTDGKGLVQMIEKWKATLVCGAPSFLKGILKNGKDDQLKSLRFCFTGAEKAPKDLFDMVRQLPNCHILEGYGITECSPILTFNRDGDQTQGVGQPLDGTEICIVNLDTHEPIPHGERGLVLAKGPNIFSGYLNQGIHSPFIKVGNDFWYSTGDLGYLTPEGSLILSGRLKRFIKIGGEMISLAAIEDALQKKLPLQQDSQEGVGLAVCAKEEESGEKTKIIVFCNASLTVEDANRYLKESGFSNIVKIYKVKELPEIPLMGTGKVNYRALESQIPEILAANQSTL